MSMIDSSTPKATVRMDGMLRIYMASVAAMGCGGYVHHGPVITLSDSYDGAKSAFLERAASMFPASNGFSQVGIGEPFDITDHIEAILDVIEAAKPLG